MNMVDLTLEDRNGVVFLARSWTPKVLRQSEDGAALLETWAYALAYCLNGLLDLNNYLPVALSPLRCDVAELSGALARLGLDDSRDLSVEQRRRLAVVGQALREWRGSFRSCRLLVSALTGGPVVILTWTNLHFVADGSCLSFTGVFDEDQDTTVVFALGQGPSATYNENLIQGYLEGATISATDLIDLVPCYALTRWRDGFNGWVTHGNPELVVSSITGEYEALKLTPNMDPDPQGIRLLSPTTCSNVADGKAWWVTTHFKTESAIGFWRLHLRSDSFADTSYAVEVPVGYGNLRYLRILNGGVIELVSFPTYVEDGLNGEYHRIDFTASMSANSIEDRLTLRACLDGQLFNQYVDNGNNPGETIGNCVKLTVTSSQLTAGSLHVAAIWAQERV